jgi:lysyl-tRNA synthetase class 2
MEEENSLIEQRRANLAALREKGIEPFANKFTPDETCAGARENYEEGREFALAGRMTAFRTMGKSIFLDIRDGSDRMQVYAQKNALGDEAFDVLKKLDLGDFIGVKGTMFTTRTEEITLKMAEFTVVGKALRPLPAKWHGLSNIETRYRQRYLDLIANDDVKQVFYKRSAIIREIRDFMHERGFIEVETPTMQAIPGGAAAQPFVTRHNALGCEFYLRIALELYLKRLLVGGMDRVFEIGRNYRNEGISPRHNPEFTMLEAYQAFGDYETMMELLESMIMRVAEKVVGTLVIEHKDAEGNVTRTIDLTGPWRRVKYKDLVREKGGADWFDVTPDERRKRALDLGAEIGPDYVDYEVTNGLFEKLIEPTLIQPTFVTHLPKELIPLAKLTPDDPTTIEVFECCINGQEIAPAYTEQNDPVAQREALQNQAGEEQQKLDEDFLVALEHGMPPAGGIGIGIDRLIMMLLGQESIRDVLLFPQLKPKPTATE